MTNPVAHARDARDALVEASQNTPAADPGGIALLDASYAWDAMTPAEWDAFIADNRYAIDQASLVSVWLRHRAYHLPDVTPAAPARFPTQRKPTGEEWRP